MTNTVIYAQLTSRRRDEEARQVCASGSVVEAAPHHDVG
jgi:hypothetical protein